jgi:hypothetical protein
MSVQEIEAAIERLSPAELAELAAWFAEYHHSRWDERIERDLAEGRLDKVIREAEAAYERGESRPL